MRPGETNECPSLVIIHINVSMNCSWVRIHLLRKPLYIQKV